MAMLNNQMVFVRGQEHERGIDQPLQRGRGREHIPDPGRARGPVRAHTGGRLHGRSHPVVVHAQQSAP